MIIIWRNIYIFVITSSIISVIQKSSVTTQDLGMLVKLVKLIKRKDFE